MIRPRVPVGFRSVLLACATLVVACASGSEQLVPLPSQAVELSRPELCRIYVFRSSQMMGSIRSMHVFDQDEEIGTLSGDEYLCWERPPGRLLLRALYEGPRIDRGELESIYDLKAEAGSVYYLSVGLLRESEDGAIGGLGDKRGTPKLQPLSAEEGRKLLRESESASR